MNEEEQEKQEEEKPKEADPFVWIVPECCREGWDSCPHVVNREKKPKKPNPGL